MLFDDIERTDETVARYTEGSFAFLNRSARRDWNQVRATLEDWFASYPKEHAEDLGGRLRSNSPGSHLAAWWELYVFTLLRAIGFAVEVHPSIDGSDRRPDFRAVAGETRLYVEAVTANSGIVDDRRDRKREAWIADAIDSTESRNFFIHLVDLEQAGLEQPSRPEITRPIDLWLRQLDPDEVSAAYAESGVFPERLLVVRDWKIRLRAFPKSAAARAKPAGRLFGAGPVTAGFVNDTEKIRVAVDEKRTSYGRLDAPLIVAGMCLSSTVDDETIAGVLFGNEVVTFARDGPGPATLARSPSGIWTRPRGSEGLDGLLIGADQLMPWTVAHRHPTLWLSPDTAEGFGDWFPFRCLVPRGGVVSPVPARCAPWEVFGLWPDWPNEPRSPEAAGTLLP